MNHDPVELLLQKLEKSTYRELGDKLGFPASYLHNVVHGKRPPSKDLLEALGLEMVYRKRRA